MLDTDEDNVDPALQAEIHTTLNNASTALKTARNAFLTKHAMHWYMRSRARAGTDPIAHLLNSLQSASRTFADECLQRGDACKLIIRIQHEATALRRHRLYRYLAFLTAYQHPSAVTLNTTLAAIDKIAIRLQKLG